MKTIINKIAKGIDFNLSENWHGECNNQHTNDDEMIYVGWVHIFDYLRGFGFIADLINNEEYYFHVSSIGEDLYSNKSPKNDELSLKCLLEQLQHKYYKSTDYKDCQLQLKQKNTEEIVTTSSCRFGTYRIAVRTNPKMPNVVESDLSNYPHIFPGQVVCFTIEDGKATNVHKPTFYISQLLKYRGSYSDNVWSLLFHFIPRVLYSIKYQGFDNIDEELDKYKEKMNSFLLNVKQFDLDSMKDIDNYKIGLSIDYHPSKSDSDPNTLCLNCKFQNSSDEYILMAFSENIGITPTIEYYGEAPLEYFEDIVYDEYKEAFNRLLNERNSIRKNKGYCDDSLLTEKYFSDVKEQWVNSFIANYSSQNHLLFYLNKLKNQFLNSCNLYAESINPEIYSNDILFEFNRALPYYGNKIEFKFSNLMWSKPYYSLYTYDSSYEGYYKGKHYINDIELEDNDYYYTLHNHILTSMNKELNDYLVSKFDILIEEYLAKL